MIKGNAGVSQGQPDVKLLGNPQWPPNLVTRTCSQSVRDCWGQRSHSGKKGITFSIFSIHLAQEL